MHHVSGLITATQRSADRIREAQKNRRQHSKALPTIPFR